jgi:hypothetical protein
VIDVTGSVGYDRNSPSALGGANGEYSTIQNFFSPLDAHSSTDGIQFADSESSSSGIGSSTFAWAFQGKP